MKKNACFSAVVACLFAVSAGNAFAGQSTVSAGYAQGDLQGVANKADGFNLKYRYEFDDSLLGVIGSFTHVEKNRSQSGYYHKSQYHSFTAGPAYRFNDWASLYGVIGVSYGKNIDNAQNGNHHSSNSDYGFTYGAGLQFNPIQDIVLDVGYEQSRIRSVDVGIWNVGVGYRF